MAKAQKKAQKNLAARIKNFEFCKTPASGATSKIQATMNRPGSLKPVR
jgi:hypothetical protein